MKQSDRPPLDDLELPLLFPENCTPAAPLAEEGNLPAPVAQVVIPLPNREPRPRIIIADDDDKVIEGLSLSLETHYAKALDVRFWQPGNGSLLVEQIMDWIRSGWRPDAVVIDINMGVGGHHGIHYLQELREKQGCAALAVVLATGNQYRDLNEGTLAANQVNWTGEDPSLWLEHARKCEPESILFGKTADALFLGRIGEHLSEWQRAARRRAWVKLLDQVAQRLDGATIKEDIVSAEIVNYVVNELDVDDAFIRLRREDDMYQLVAADTTRERPYVHLGESIIASTVPILNEILGNNRTPVLREKLTKEETGTFAKTIAYHHFLGVGMVLGDRSVGFITLLRFPNKRNFEEDIDGQHLAVLARLLASAFGRDALMRSRQTRLLDFAKSVSNANRITDVSQNLVTTLHQELHGYDDENSKTTLRLLDFGSGVLQRLSIKGMASEDVDIAITDAHSIYADCVRFNRLFRIEDVCSPEWAMRYKNLCKVNSVRSELCVPLTIGEHAIGAVNLEHLSVDFYRFHDEGFIQAAAGLAAAAIERICTTNVLEGMADFVYRFYHEDTKTLDHRLRELLYNFCSYSVLVDLELNNAKPWAVRHVECKFLVTSQEKVRRQIEMSYENQWEQTWVSKLYREQAWKDGWAHYTKEVSEFIPVILADDDGRDNQQKADALLWLRRDNNPPHRALLLLWYLPPPMNDAGITLLGSLARLFSELDHRKNRIRELMDENLLSEQAAQIGHVMQHFRHRLGNLTGSMSTHIQRVETAHRLEDESRFGQAMEDLRANAREIANSFNKSKGYVKKPEPSWVLLEDLINKAMTPKGLAERLQNVTVQIELPAGIQVWTDVEIASLVLFSLIENALDAVETRDLPSIGLRAETRESMVILHVSDNGPGVAEDFRANLFEWGKTTKSDGLGSALAFARTRMRQLHGDLVFPATQPPSGALFEISFPTEPKESIQ